jgi:hypothetical protein
MKLIYHTYRLENDGRNQQQASMSNNKCRRTPCIHQKAGRHEHILLALVELVFFN